DPAAPELIHWTVNDRANYPSFEAPSACASGRRSDLHPLRLHHREPLIALRRDIVADLAIGSDAADMANDHFALTGRSRVRALRALETYACSCSVKLFFKPD